MEGKEEFALSGVRPRSLVERSRSVVSSYDYYESNLPFDFAAKKQRLRSGRINEMNMLYVVYILECADGSYYTGSGADLSQRLWQHESGASPTSYIFSRRPVKLVWTSKEVRNYSQALQWERQIKGWSRAKKQALIRGDFDSIHEIVKMERKRNERIKKSPPR